MSLSSELISQFAKITKDKEEVKKETTVYGTIVNYNGSTYVKLDGSDLLTPISTTTETQSGERVTVMIKNHTATVTGNISSPAARTDDVKEIGNKISEFEIVIADKVSTKQLEATVGRIETLESDNVTIKEKLTANEAVINNLDATYAKVENLNSTNAEIQNLKTTKLDASIADIKYATIDDLDATKAEIDNLDATYATITSLEATNASIKNLDSKYATIEKLNATNAEIEELEAKSLTADSAVIKDLEADVAKVDTLIFGAASGDSIQTSFANAVIAQLGEAQIKSAMIDSITANQIQSGQLITNDVIVTSSDGKLLISDETIQIKDANRVRVQIGKDSSGDYSINIWDADGKLMFSEGGLTESAIKESIIRDDMVSNTANIAASKLNISSLFEVINEDGSNTLNSSKIAMDGEGQTLDVAFTSMTNDVSGLKGTVSSQGTAISVMQGQIFSKVWKQDINDAKDELSTQYSNLEQTVDGINATVASHTTQIQNKADASKVTEVSNKVTELNASLDGFKSSVSDTYATKTELNAVEIGGRNLIVGSSRYTKDSPCTHASSAVDGQKFLTSALWMPVEPGQSYIFQCCSDGPWGNHISDGTGGGVTHPFLYLMTDDTVIGTWKKALLLDLSCKINDNPTGRGVWKFTVPDDGNAYTRLMIRLDIHSDGETVYSYNYWDFKAEKGNKATDWTPAPEDVDDKIGSVDDRLVSAQTQINQNSEQIALRATKTEVNNQLSGYYTKSQTDAAITTKANEINLSVSETYATKNEVDSIEIGGRNLIPVSKIASARGITTTETFNLRDVWASPFIGNVDLVTLLEPATEYTIRYNIQLIGRTSVPTPFDMMCGFMIYSSSSGTWISLATNMSADTPVGTTKTVERTFTTPDEWTDEGIICYSRRWTTEGVAPFGNDSFLITDFKIEKGNKATDWTPAPEDTDELITETASILRLEADGISSDVTEVVDRVTVAESSIQQLADQIVMLITDENGETALTQTEEGWTFNINKIMNPLNSATTDIEQLTKDLGGVDNTVNDLQQAVADLGVLTDYVIITTYNDQPCIELGEAENGFKLRITNTQIQFLADGTIPAWLSNQKLYIEKAEVTNELQFGGFVWKARANGNMGLVWKGVSS